MTNTNVTSLASARRRDDTSPPSTAPETATRLLPPLPADFHPPYISTASAALRRSALIAQAKRVEQQIHADKLRQRELSQARDEGFKKGSARGYAQGRHWGLLLGLLSGLAIGGGLVGLFIRAGMRAAAGT